jgi:hypothetical protein
MKLDGNVDRNVAACANRLDRSTDHCHTSRRIVTPPNRCLDCPDGQIVTLPNQCASNRQNGGSAPVSVPEPGTFVLLGLGLVGVALMRRQSN